MIKYNKYKITSVTKAIPMCDDCNIELVNTNIQLLSNPPQDIYRCEKCGKEYHIYSKDLLDKYTYEYIGDDNSES